MLEINIKKLEQELKDSIEGEVRFDDGSRALYAKEQIEQATGRKVLHLSQVLKMAL